MKSMRVLIDTNIMMDLEDGLQMECADKMQIDYIVIRNIKDFKMSRVTVVEQERFIEVYKMYCSDS